MNRVPTVAQLRANIDGGRGGDRTPASDPTVVPLGTLPSQPGDTGILVAFMAAVSAGIIIWGLALGYLRF
jgi:hypothetical protein